MPVYELPSEIAFPDPCEAEPDGLLAVGGDLSPERVLAAYSVGIFPWPHKGWPLLWFSPDPRMVLPLNDLRVSRSLRQTMRKAPYEIRLDTDFAGVIEACGKTRRRGQKGTWITDELAQAYTRLHELGFAHSAEAWQDGKLVGGLYGLSLGGAFFGESMFAHAPDASKIAFVSLVNQLKLWGFHFVDAQVHTDHLERFGAREIPRAEYLVSLQEALAMPTRRGPWSLTDPTAH
ncbi:MAG: leucyl/phenylalanyl-tRNA--protein transferase [Planctomycetes bacterium]|nr:leucyl/phenylalanyl-tRNA--protein transferase [Planctomycetota bacterium]